MKQLRTITLMAAVAATLALLTTQLATGRERGPNARSLQEVDAIWLDSNSCRGGIADEVADHDFFVAHSPRASDAVLDVNVHELDASVGNAARYTAKLRGDDGRVLFSMTGYEESISYNELCEDIGDEILDHLENRKG